MTLSGDVAMHQSKRVACDMNFVVKMAHGTCQELSIYFREQQQIVYDVAWPSKSIIGSKSMCLLSQRLARRDLVNQVGELY